MFSASRAFGFRAFATFAGVMLSVAIRLPPVRAETANHIGSAPGTVPPVFVSPSEKLPAPTSRLLQDLIHKPPRPVEPRPLHGRVAPGYDFDTLMRERGSGPEECRLDFDIANIGDHTFQTVTIDLAVHLKASRTPHEEELPLVEPLEPDHRVTAQLEVSSPCIDVAEVRLRGFSRCTIDTVQMGVCRPLMLMRSNSRIRFGL
jgi:hypothetical protein